MSALPEVVVLLVEPEQRELARLRQDVIRIGKRPECEVRLEGSYLVSGVHAVLTWRDDGLWVDNPGAARGVYLRGQLVVPRSPVRLSPGDRLQLADRLVEVRFEPLPAPPPPAP